jgi:branched-chain amino acid transport system ATP-binding protein
MMSEPVVAIQDLTVAHGATLAVKGVTVRAFENEIMAIVGPNGAGKTTLLETIVGLHKARAGSVEFLSKPVSGLSVFKRRKMGMVLVAQEENIFTGMTVKENLEMGGFLVSSESKRKKMAYVYELFPRLKERERQMANTLSGGERRMLAIGMGIVASARLILIDEPSVGLAPKLVTTVLEGLRQLREDIRLPVLLSEQNIKVLRIADRVFGMEAGEEKFNANCGEISIARIKELYMGLSCAEAVGEES